MIFYFIYIININYTMKYIKLWENFSKSSHISYDDTRDIAIRITDKLVGMGYVPDNIDSDDEDEFNVQDLIHEEINKALGISNPDEFEPNEFED